MTTTDLLHHDVLANGLLMHVAEQGRGPLVLLCHGFPEGWYSWRHQLPALAGAGYRAVAPDLRGYGRSEGPPDITAYNILELVGDLVALIAALGEQRAFVVGHDWGAVLAWHAALLRPDVFSAVAGLSVPFRIRGTIPPLRVLRRGGLYTHYWLYFQDPGVAEAELEADPRATLRRLLYTLSGDAPADRPTLLLQPGKGLLDNTLDPSALPSWLGEADLDHMAGEFLRTGFRGALNWYRNLDRNWELTAAWSGAAIHQPALFIAGREDPVIAGGSGKLAMQSQRHTVPGLRKLVLIDGAGHWIQQERPVIVNDALIAFLREASG